MSQVLSVTSLIKRYGDVTAVNDISFAVQQNEFFSLLGPSGCGKTTTLRSVAGLESAQHGSIRIGDNLVYDAGKCLDLPAHKRPIGMVFQSYAVWPHMTVFENIAYPLKVRGKSKPDIRTAVDRILTMLGMADLGNRIPSELSGGQQQRVALGRALVMEPQLLLLDEPLSNLDAKLRESMRAELKQVQRETTLPILYVTHDQEEALAMSDRIAVMEGGNIHQIASPTQIYHRPATRFVLDFIGTTSYLDCEIKGLNENGVHVSWGESENTAIAKLQPTLDTPATGRALIAVRPEQIGLTSERCPDTTEAVKGTIIIRSFLGSHCEYHVRVGSQLLRAKTANDLLFEENETVLVTFQDGLVLSHQQDTQTSLFTS